LGAASLLFAPNLTACSAQSARRNAVVLEDDATKFSPTFAAELLERIRTLAKNPGEELSVNFPTVAGTEKTLIFSFQKKKGVAHPHLVIRRDDGRRLSLLHEGRGPLPAIRFIGDDGKPLVSLGDHLKRGWEAIMDRLYGEDTIAIGIKAVALALAVWIGATIGKVVLAALAFVAFFAVVISLIFVGAAAIVTLLGKKYTFAEDAVEDVKHMFVRQAYHFQNLVKSIG